MLTACRPHGRYAPALSALSFERFRKAGGVGSAGPAYPTSDRVRLFGGDQPLAPKQFLHPDLSGIKSVAQYLNRVPGTGIATHEHVKGTIADLGPSVGRNMALGQHGHAADALRREFMRVNMQERCSAGFDAFPECPLDTRFAVQPFSFHDLDDEMRPGINAAIITDEMVV